MTNQNQNKTINLENGLTGIYIEKQGAGKVYCNGKNLVYRKDNGVEIRGQNLVEKLENVKIEDKVYDLYRFAVGDLKIGFADSAYQ